MTLQEKKEACERELSRIDELLSLVYKKGEVCIVSWGEKLREKLPCQVYDLVAGYMGAEKLVKEFTGWHNFDGYFTFADKKEGGNYFNGVHDFLNDDLSNCPLPPKPELRIKTSAELAGKYVVNGNSWFLVANNEIDIMWHHKHGFKWASHPSSEQFSLMVEV